MEILIVGIVHLVLGYLICRIAIYYSLRDKDTAVTSFLITIVLGVTLPKLITPSAFALIVGVIAGIAGYIAGLVLYSRKNR